MVQVKKEENIKKNKHRRNGKRGNRQRTETEKARKKHVWERKIRRYKRTTTTSTRHVTVKYALT